MNGTIKPLNRGAAIRFPVKDDIRDIVDFRSAMLDRIEKGETYLTVDMSDTLVVDSAGLGILVTGYKRLQEKGGHLIIRGVRNSVKETFVQARLSDIFTFQ
ncbi:STAS domain-containing protein [Halobacillus sp. ACCC02827]|uniref:STAS domain-containing protein n=1 Tax=Bacillaceae TaxID=186817 RepID=UPI0002A4E5E6|nr:MULTISPECIES: STAS domain-containing protein [Bacillaceae]ELK47587.1 anti-sigma-factor antagonist [Halobacillus sp. BAB-2008]QHT45902.1 STAS domain-containing protein [Bacillus sp. SB49]WJE16709.1 STAS domain-containing protein [Halobacillus sp. ACCC02827]